MFPYKEGENEQKLIMERFELIIILSLLAGLMFFLGWFGSLIYSYFFGKKTEQQNLVRELYQKLSQAQHRNDDLLENHNLQEQKWLAEIEGLKRENNEFLNTHRFYQDRIYDLEQKLKNEGS